MKRSRIPQSVRRKAEEMITDSFYETTKDMSREELLQYALNITLESNQRKLETEILRNAWYGAKSECLPLRLFNPDTFEIPDTCDASIQNQIEECNRELAEQHKIVSEYHANCAKELEAKLSAKPNKKKKKLRRVDQVVDFNASEDEVCEICGSKMQHIGYKTRQKIQFIPAKIVVTEERYETISCPNKCLDQNEKAIIRTVQPQEPDLIDKSPATESLVAGLVYEKFVMGTPLYRLEKQFDDNDVPLSRQTMSNITQKCFFQYLKPVYSQMLSDFKNLSVLHLDETSLKCLELREEHKQSVMVAGASGDKEDIQMAVYRFFPGKAQSFVNEMLGSDFQGTLMTDGLKAYRNYPSGIKLNCMAHARRRMFEATVYRDDYKQFKVLQKRSIREAEEYLKGNPSLNILISALTAYGDLYRVEREYYGNPVDIIYEVRQRISRPAFKRLSLIMQEIQSGFTPGSPAEKAATYFLEREAELGRYLDHGAYPIDNNKAERTVKPFVIARKNFLFTQSEDGAVAAACYMTLLESARMNGMNPRRYLEYILSQLKHYRDQELPEEVLKSLVPYSKKMPADLYNLTDPEEE